MLCYLLIYLVVSSYNANPNNLYNIVYSDSPDPIQMQIIEYQHIPYDKITYNPSI